MNPPLASREDRDALIAGLADGTVDAIATDHAPHDPASKDVEFDRAPFGITGFETAIALALEQLVRTDRISLMRMVELFTTGPARVLGKENGSQAAKAALRTLQFFPPTAPGHTARLNPPAAPATRPLTIAISTAARSPQSSLAKSLGAAELYLFLDLFREKPSKAPTHAPRPFRCSSAARRNKIRGPRPRIPGPRTSCVRSAMHRPPPLAPLRPDVFIEPAPKQKNRRANLACALE